MLADRVDSAPQHESCPLNKLVRECRSAIQKGLGKSLVSTVQLPNPHIQHPLGDVLHDSGVTRSVSMNYDNYEHKIVECFTIELIGWPNNLLPICNPGQLGGRDQVQKLLVALTTKVCHWKKLSEEDRQRRIELNTEHHAQGEQVYKLSKKCTLHGTKKSAEIIASDNGDSGDEGNSAV